MKRILSFVLLAALMLSLSACAEPEPASMPTAAPTEEPIAATQPVFATVNNTQPPESAIVYEGAVKDFLLPLEDYSWEWEHEPRFVMVHFCSAVVNHRDDPYNMDAVRSTFVEYNVSTHYIIDRDGLVRCYIPENRVAWHAGKGEWGGDPQYTNAMNHYAIGIELVAIGSQSDMSQYLTDEEYAALDESLLGFTDAQYEALKLLIEDLCRRYSISMDRSHIIGHEDYASRKDDPGELFDWDRVVPEGVG